MKPLIFLTSILVLLLSCSKEEGKGGRSSITGKVHMTDISGMNQGEYDAPDYDVYIIYGDENDIYDDDMKTNFDGTFEFKNLRAGNYRVYAYTIDGNEESGVKAVFKSAEIGKDETVDVGTIEVEK
jgi:hypothetical protein